MARNRRSSCPLPARPHPHHQNRQALEPSAGAGPRAGVAAAAFALLGLLVSPMLLHPAALAQSSLLESVKRNPAEARKLCNQLRQVNQQGLSYTDKQVLQRIATQENLSLMDAEVLTTYVVGLHCPDVR